MQISPGELTEGHETLYKPIHLGRISLAQQNVCLEKSWRQDTWIRYILIPEKVRKKPKILGTAWEKQPRVSDWEPCAPRKPFRGKREERTVKIDCLGLHRCMHLSKLSNYASKTEVFPSKEGKKCKILPQKKKKNINKHWALVNYIHAKALSRELWCL